MSKIYYWLFIILLFNVSTSAYQGRIYVADQYPAFAKNMLIVGQKLRTSCQIILNKKKNLFVLIKNEQILRHNTHFFHILSTLLLGVKDSTP